MAASDERNYPVSLDSYSMINTPYETNEYTDLSQTLNDSAERQTSLLDIPTFMTQNPAQMWSHYSQTSQYMGYMGDSPESTSNVSPLTNTTFESVGLSTPASFMKQVGSNEWVDIHNSNLYSNFKHIYGQSPESIDMMGHHSTNSLSHDSLYSAGIGISIGGVLMNFEPTKTIVPGSIVQSGMVSGISPISSSTFELPLGIASKPQSPSMQTMNIFESTTMFTNNTSKSKSSKAAQRRAPAQATNIVATQEMDMSTLKRLRNKVSASRSRNKKKLWLKQIKDASAILQEENKYLIGLVTELETQINQCRQTLAQKTNTES